VHAEDFLVNDGCNGKAVEAVGKGFPQFDVKSPLAWLEERVGRWLGKERERKRKGKKKKGGEKKEKRTLVVKAVDSIDASALVITTKNEKVFRVLDFVSEEEADSFKTLLTTIHVISQEKII